MVRSMYSGVAGMKAHQTRMDVIGNNIANVNTYGYKSARATFRDMYYQNIRSATAGTANRGGINPSSIGYGSAVSSVDIIMTTSSVTSTGNPLDVAITGEGFLQVMDSDGNIFYTKAGMLDIDANGNLIDTNGYFVLGTSGNPLGKSPGSEKIKFDIPSVDPTIASAEESINGIIFGIEATNYTADGNVNFVFQARDDLPMGQNVKALMDGKSITIQVNSSATFADLNEFQNAMNTAITEANNGMVHPAGEFRISMSTPARFSNLTGSEICGTNYGVVKGSVNVPTTPVATFGGMKFVDVGDNFSGTGTTTYSLDYNTATPPDEPSITITAAVGGVSYQCTFKQSDLGSGKSALLTINGTGPQDDSITLSIPSWNTLINISTDPTLATTPTWTPADSGGIDAVPSAPARDIGLGSKSLTLENGTLGGPQSLKDLTGISISSDGTILASHGILGELTIGRIDLASFDSARGLQLVGSSYFAKTANSGEPALSIPGEDGTGALLNNSLELSSVDLSQEFSDMIVTQRGFQANSRLITVSDTMLEELINLKR